MQTKLRVSFIDFLNSVPLGWSFLFGDQRETFDLLFDVPSQCADHLRGTEADVGLIPVIEYQRIPGLSIIPDISISSKREVRTVLFVSNVPVDRVRSIAVDTSSRTSVALLKIVLRVFHKRDDLTFQPAAPDASRMLANHDAALIIGNPAFRLPERKLWIVDLAREWNRFTGLPFVFAFWAVRKGIDLGDSCKLFRESRDQGLLHVEEIAQRYAPRLGLTEHEVCRYIRDNLNYTLDAENKRGLELFFHLAAETGLTPAAAPLRFITSAHSVIDV